MSLTSDNFSIGDLSSDEFKKNGKYLIDWIAGYFESLEDKPVIPQIKPGNIKSKLPETPPFKSESLEKIFKDVDEIIMPGMTHWNHPGFMAYFNSTSTGPAIFGELLSAAFNINGMLWQSCPASVELEKVVIDWVRQMLNLHENFWGTSYDTASVSSFHAIASARQLAYEKYGEDKLDKFVVYSSEHAHSSIDKAAIAAGFRKQNIKKVEVDDDFRMSPNFLKQLVEEDKNKGLIPVCVTATVGTTSTTSIDPVEEISKICEENGLWLHVDAAHGGVLAMLPEKSYILEGCEKADSFVVNPHKWMFVPIDISLLFVKKPEILKRAFTLIPEYLKTEHDDEAENPMDYGIQLGRRFRALKLWFAIRFFGTEGYRKIYREHIRIALLFREWIIQDENFELAAPTPMSTVCFRAVPGKSQDMDELNSLNKELISKINSSGKIFLTHTKLNEKFVVRLVVSGIRTYESHVRMAYDIIKKSLQEIMKEKES
jgi:aromatic-L-amino-acid decarboxylase